MNPAPPGDEERLHGPLPYQHLAELTHYLQRLRRRTACLAPPGMGLRCTRPRGGRVPRTPCSARGGSVLMAGQSSLGIGSSHSPDAPARAVGRPSARATPDRDRGTRAGVRGAWGRAQKAAWDRPASSTRTRPPRPSPRGDAGPPPSGPVLGGTSLADRRALDALLIVVGGRSGGGGFSADAQPAVCIYWGDAVEKPAPRPSDKDGRPRSARAYWGYYGDGTKPDVPGRHGRSGRQPRRDAHARTHAFRRGPRPPSSPGMAPPRANAWELRASSA